MNRTEKSDFVTNLKTGLESSQAFAILSFSKINVEQMTEFRLSLKKKNIQVRVIKNTLAKRALSGSPYEALTEQFVGPTLVAYSPDDPIVTAKAIWEWAGKENFSVEVKGGAALGQTVSKDQLQALSKLPGRNELFVSFLWALKSAPTRFLYALQDAPQRLGYALQALKEQKSQNPSA